MSDVLTNAKRDAEDLSKVVNNTSGTVANRTGSQITPLPVVIADIQSQGSSAISEFETQGGSAISGFETQGSSAISSIQSQAGAAIASIGWFVVGEFSAGFTYTAANQVGVDANGNTWSYNGSFPFTVSAGTTPSEPDYTNRGDAALRSELAGDTGHRLVSNQLSANAYGAPAKAVNVQTGVDAPTVIDYFDGYFWGYRSNNLERSHDGISWEIYATGLGFNFSRLIPTSDGEVVGIATDGVTVRKSVGFYSGNITWKTVLTNPSPANQAPFLRFGFDGAGSKFIVTHYGSGVSNWANSRYVWISTDAGETWDIVYDTDAEYPGLSSESHLHAACYDPWGDRFYFTEGHGTPRGIYYSDDNGSTWSQVTSQPFNPAPTVLVAAEFGIVIGTDSEPNGVALLRRSASPTGDDVDFLGTVSSYGARGGVIGFADRGMRDPDSGIVYIAFNSEFETNPTTIFAVGSGGAMPVLESVGGGGPGIINRYSNVVGAQGKLLATHNVDGRVVADLPPYTQMLKPFDTGNLTPEVKRTRQLAMAVGRGAVATGLNSLSIGGQTASSQDRLVISYRGNPGSGANGVVIGNTASAGDNAVALGFGSSASNSALAVGHQANASAFNTALGNGAGALNTQTTAIGRNATASVSFSVAIGDSANANGSYAIAIGRGASAVTSSIAMGGDNTIGANSVGVGRATITGVDSASIGRSAEAGNFSVSFGREAKSQINCVAIGYQASALLQFAIAIGDSSLAGSASDVVIGRSAKSLAGVSPQTVLGRSAESDAPGGTAIGNLAKVADGHFESVAIGRNTETQRSSSVCVGNRDIESTRTSGRLILRSPDGTPWAITVDNTGAITASAI